MPSSNKSRFWQTLILASVSMIALLIAASWSLDPFGTRVTVIGGPAICAPGIKSGSAVAFAPLVAIARRPETIVLGSSRVLNGFDSKALTHFSGPSANLGVAAVQIGEMHQLFDLAQSRGKLRHMIIGVDLGMFLVRKSPSRLVAVNPNWSNTQIAWVHGVAGRDALSATLRNVHRCRSPQFWIDGSPMAVPGTKLSEDAVERALRRAFARMSRPDLQSIKDRLAEFEMLVADARRRGVRVTLFIGPHRPNWAKHAAAAGLADTEAAVNRNIADISAQHSASLIETNTTAFATRAGLARCADGTTSCHFIDATHYAPTFGRAIAATIEASP